MIKKHEQILKTSILPYEDRMSREEINVIKLATAHWSYVSGILAAHGVEPDSLLLNACKYHYLTAFEHGWKHAVEAGVINDQQ